MIYHLVVISVLSLTVCTGCAPSALARARPIGVEKMLSQTVGEFELRGNMELQDICRKLAIACGEERYAADWWDHEETPATPLKSTRLKGETFETVLDAIVARHPGYRWKNYGMVIVLEPIKSPRTSPLHNKIQKFELRNKPIYTAIREAAKVAGVKDVGEISQSLGSPAMEESASRNYGRHIDINLKHSTLHEVLCAIVGAHRSSYWVYLHAEVGEAPDPDFVSFAAY